LYFFERRQQVAFFEDNFGAMAGGVSAFGPQSAGPFCAGVKF